MKAWVGVLVLVLGSAAQARQEVDLSGKGWRLWLDREARWEQEEVVLPPVDVGKLPVRAPTGGWQALESAGVKDVSVPGTVEEYLQTVPGPQGDIKGVSWWYRTMRIPQVGEGQRTLLRFESVRMRAEVFVNRKLVGYDLIGNTPFEVDISDAARPGEVVELALRITDPGGDFAWNDGMPIPWGKVQVAGSHGFGGVSGRVKLVACEAVRVQDIYVQNTPAMTEVNALVSVVNSGATEAVRDVRVSVIERGGSAGGGGGAEVFGTVVRGLAVRPGESQVSVKISAPKAKLWDLDQPNLYRCVVSLVDAGVQRDRDERTFGFRWFAPENIGTDAVFKLNGKRIVLRSAISWGFWPVNGLYATAEMAEKQIRTAKSLGLNMLSFHRCLGQPVILEKADELGLLYYQEPGNFACGNKDPFARACVDQKVLRMVARDRSHPSLIIYNMGNEMRESTDEATAWHAEIIRRAHALDPSRVITRTSAWAMVDDVESSAKMHMRPFDDRLYLNGWFDTHYATGQACWLQAFYGNPGEYYHNTHNKAEIVYWGEEGAISTPPRLGAINAELSRTPNLGWDGKLYVQWFNAFDQFLADKKLRAYFPTVDTLTMAMGKVSLEHQGRKIETIRMNNLADGYVINGWEAEIIENHSGIVDCFRNPKGEAWVLAYYNQPLYVAVKVRSQIVKIPGEVVVDFYAINEKDVKGPHTLRIAGWGPNGKEVFRKDVAVNVSGGERFGQLLAEGVTVPVNRAAGMYRIEARLLDADGREQARGRDEILGVDCAGARLGGRGAVWESGSVIKGFLKQQMGVEVAAYEDGLAKLDWVVAAGSPQGGDRELVPTEALRDATGEAKGITATFFMGANFEKQVARRIDRKIDLNMPEDGMPDDAITTMEGYSVRWEGRMIPPVSGVYTFDTQGSGATSVTIDGKQVIGGANVRSGKGKVDLIGGKAVSLVVELRHKRYMGICRLFWTPPQTRQPDAQRLMDRVKNDGVTLIILENAAAWMDLIGKNTAVRCTGKFKVGTTWMGGQHFVRAHPLFKDLPSNQAMNWPFQAVVRNGNERLGLEMAGEELVAGAYHSFPNQLGTAVGVIACGKGKIVFSTLDIYNNLDSPEAPAEVARKLLCNFIEFGRR